MNDSVLNDTFSFYK